MFLQNGNSVLPFIQKALYYRSLSGLGVVTFIEGIDYISATLVCPFLTFDSIIVSRSDKVKVNKSQIIILFLYYSLIFLIILVFAQF